MAMRRGISDWFDRLKGTGFDHANDKDWADDDDQQWLVQFLDQYDDQVMEKISRLRRSRN